VLAVPAALSTSFVVSRDGTGPAGLERMTILVSGSTVPPDENVPSLRRMKRSVVLHGTAAAPSEALARVVAERGSGTLVSVADGASLERVIEASSPRVVVADRRALRDRATRLRVLERAVVVSLGDDDSDAAVEAHLLVDPSSVEAAAEAVQEAWERDCIAVAAGRRSYTVEVASGVLSERLPGLVGKAPVALLVTDGNVEPLHARKVTEPLAGGATRVLGHVMKPGEKSKIVRTIVQIWNLALEGGADRSAVLVGLGGGVVTDVTGFAAATWMRGVRWIALPTTLLAMVDASVGGKTGVDLRSAKNAVGAFWQPCAVVCDVATLETEPERGFISALAEVVKTALIGDPELLALLESRSDEVLRRSPALLADIVRRCVTVKARVVGLDEREGGLRAILNLGHTIGHALEAHSGYALAHGEAVSLGLVSACRVGEQLGAHGPDLTERVIRLLGRLSLPTELGEFDMVAVSALLGHDKKRAGSQVRFVVIKDVGRVETVPVGLEELRSMTRALA
jgi:shikimate kinase/3-dehydroquinate synthase